MTLQLMTDKVMDVIKGWFRPSALDFEAKISSSVTFDVPEGRVMHVNASGELETGISGSQMAIFLLQDSTDPDVTTENVEGAVSIAPTGVSSGLVATGAYEIQTTEFINTLTYAPNDLLTAPTDNADVDVGGLLTNDSITLYTTAVCGVVSRGKTTNHFGKPVISFWPVYVPGT